MKAIYILVPANLIVWGYLVWSGLEGMRSVQAQHASGYPNSGQIGFYVGFPLFVAALSVVAPFLLRRKPRAGVGIATTIVTLLLVLP